MTLTFKIVATLAVLGWLGTAVLTGLEGTPFMSYGLRAVRGVCVFVGILAIAALALTVVWGL